jgi:S1-C subfamily serine protease
MRAFFVVLLALVIAACARPMPSAPFSRVEAAKDLTSKTVALVIPNKTGQLRPYCSGVWVSRSAILTAHHCVDEHEVGDSLSYATHDDVYTPGELHERARIVPRNAVVQALDDEHDLALLQGQDLPQHGIARINLNEVARAGMLAQSLGSPINQWFSYSVGDVASVRQEDIGGADLVWVQATTPISPGNSGGGLFSESGALLGIASRAFGGRAQNLNFFVHYQYADALMRKQPYL